MSAASDKLLETARAKHEAGDETGAIILANAAGLMEAHDEMKDEEHVVFKLLRKTA